MRPMRRSRQALTPEETTDILKRGKTGILALNGDDGMPYAVPVNYLYRAGRIYIHGAKKGYKLDCIARSPKCSFCVVDEDRIVPEKYTTYFRSAMAFGSVRVMTNEAEMRGAVRELALKYCADYADGIEAEIDREWAGLGMLEMTVEEMSGKECIELVRAREQG